MENHAGSGGVSFSGCAGVRVEPYYLSMYPAGSIVYLTFRARKGILEKVAIKKELIRVEGGSYFVLYKDTFNSLYNESDLCDRQTAIDLASAYAARTASSHFEFPCQ